MKEEKGKNFSKDVKMHLACLKEDVTNPTLGCIYIKNGYAYASDRSILVRNDLRDMSNFDDADIEALDGKYIPADFYKEIIKYDDCLISDEGIECHKDDDKAFFYFKVFGDSKYPNADQVLENALNKMTVPMPQIGFDVKKMQTLYKALYGANQCKATFKGEGQPIVFYSLEKSSNSVGILMPVTINED